MAVLYTQASALVVLMQSRIPLYVFDAVYYATMTVTELGNSGITLVTNIGKIVTMVSSVLGIVIVALPAAILTAGYIHEMKRFESNTK